MNRFIKYGLLILALILVGYNSIYIKKLSDVKDATESKFNAVGFASKIWKDRLPAKLDSAIDINRLRHLIKANPDQTFEQYTHALAIGNNRCALIKGEAKVTAVGEDNVQIAINGDHPFDAILATEFVYGNTLRDASGLIDLKDFSSTADLNSLSKELNNIVRKEVVPGFKPQLKSGMIIDFVGAIELNKAHIHFDGLEIVPIIVKIIP